MFVARFSSPKASLSGIALARIGFGRETDGALLTDLTLRNASPEISSRVLLPTGPNRAELSFDFNPALQQTGARDLAQLAFRAGPGPGSAMAPLRITQIIGQRANGLTLSNATGLNGRVFVFGRETLFDGARLGNQPFHLTLYGRPGTTNRVESKPVPPGNDWTLLSIGVLTNTFKLLTPVNATHAARFWRALTQWPDDAGSHGTRGVGSPSGSALG